jgi:hypothetical protein
MNLPNLHQIMVMEWVLDRHLEPIVTCKNACCRQMLTLKRSIDDELNDADEFGDTSYE